MTIETLMSLADEASIVLAHDNHAFEGAPINAAEYVYFKAIREGRLEPLYWIEQALDIVTVWEQMRLENVTIDEQPKEEGDELQTEGERQDNAVAVTV